MTGPSAHLSPTWVADAVFYQIFPDRFFIGNRARDLAARDLSAAGLAAAGLGAWGDPPTRENFFGGDLKGIYDRLDYLQDLGVNALYLNPIFQAGTNHRYDTIDYFKVDPLLGDTGMLKELVAELHRRRMHIILDGVFNHCGDRFPAFQDVLQKGGGSEFAAWFHALSYPLHAEPINYLSCGGCTYLPKLNHASRPVREFLFSVAEFWLNEVGIDGWRLDVPYKIDPEFWRAFREVVKSANPQAYLVGEVWRDAQPWIQGDIFDGTTNYRLRELVVDYVLTQVLDAEDFAYEIQTLLRSHGPAANMMFNLLGSHDTPRILTVMKGDASLLKVALTIQMTLPGSPMIYYGDEIGLRGGADPDCRRCMPWKPEEWNAEILSETKSLVALRHAHPALRSGQLIPLMSVNGVFAYKQQSAGDEVLVILNPREAFIDLAVPTFSPVSEWVELFSNSPFSAREGMLHFDRVPEKSALVLTRSTVT